MKAARLVSSGETPAFRCVEVADPVPGTGEVVVDVVAAALNRRDWWLWREAATPVPVTLGSDAAGRVSAVGPEIDAGLIGSEVVINPTLGWARGETVPGPAFEILGSPRDGTLAERVVVPVQNIAPKPARLSWEEAAALSLAGLTAWRATVTCARVTAGRRLLVTGAGSGVATFVVQIAAALGGEVWVTTSSQEKLQRLVDLGARGGALYTQPEWGDQLRDAAGGGFGAAVDSFGGSGWQSILPTLEWGGVLVNFGDTGAATATVTVSDVYWAWRSIVGTTMGSPEEYRALLDHVGAESWKPMIDSVFELDDIDAAARRLTHPDRFGKVVVTTSLGASSTRHA
jgi:NADPH:quinone reductase-like Zn-dependent oxidoreductase